MLAGRHNCTASTTRLRIEADQCTRRGDSAILGLFCIAILFVIVLAPFDRLGQEGLVVLGALCTGLFLSTLYFALCRVETELDRSSDQATHAVVCLGRRRVIASIPLAELKTVRVRKVTSLEGAKTLGELQLVRRDGKVFARYLFSSLYAAEKVRKQIRAWLTESQGQPPAT